MVSTSADEVGGRKLATVTVSDPGPGIDPRMQEKVFEPFVTSYQVGVGGARLPTADRQKVAIARALLKRPAVLVLDQAAGSLDAGSQNRIVASILESRRGRCVFWALQRNDLAERFGHTLVMERGRLAEQGRFDDLKARGGALQKLLSAGWS